MNEDVLPLSSFLLHMLQPSLAAGSVMVVYRAQNALDMGACSVALCLGSLAAGSVIASIWIPVEVLEKMNPWLRRA